MEVSSAASLSGFVSRVGTGGGEYDRMSDQTEPPFLGGGRNLDSLIRIHRGLGYVSDAIVCPGRRC